MKTISDVNALAEYLDIIADKGVFTLYDYVFLRRANLALTNCGDQGLLAPNKLFCGLSITSPRTRMISPPEEKDVYMAGVMLTHGFYFGQQTWLSPLQFISVA